MSTRAALNYMIILFYFILFYNEIASIHPGKCSFTCCLKAMISIVDLCTFIPSVTECLFKAVQELRKFPLM